MAAFEVPLSANAQSFQITILNVPYVFTVQWRNAASLWYLDISDVSSRTIIGGLPMVTGADLLGQYAYLGLGFQLRVQSDVFPDDLPTYDNLGTVSHLYVITP